MLHRRPKPPDGHAARRAAAMPILALALVACASSVAGAQALPTGHADYQLGGAYQPPPGVAIVARDRAELPAAGIYSICYLNAFQTQAEETDWWKQQHSDLLLRAKDGSFHEDENWHGELLLDTSTAEKREALFAIIRDWIRGCRDSGFQAVVADNFDSSLRSGSLLTMEHNLEFAKLLAREAHEAGLAIGQVNAAELTAEARNLVGFDFAVTESCQVYEECEDYTAVYGNQVIEIEYTDAGREHFEAACAVRGASIPVTLKDRDLVPAGEPGHHFEAC